MLINSIELEKLGYSKSKSHDLMNQLCRQLPYTTKQVYLKTNRHENSEMLHNLRSVEVSEVVKLCEDKIAKAKTNKRINAEQWRALCSKLKTIDIAQIKC